jgi:hypothetical protein
MWCMAMGRAASSVPAPTRPDSTRRGSAPSALAPAGGWLRRLDSTRLNCPPPLAGRLAAWLLAAARCLLPAACWWLAAAADALVRSRCRRRRRLRSGRLHSPRAPLEALDHVPRGSNGRGRADDRRSNHSARRLLTRHAARSSSRCVPSGSSCACPRSGCAGPRHLTRRSAHRRSTRRCSAHRRSAHPRRAHHHRAHHPMRTTTRARRRACRQGLAQAQRALMAPAV